MKVIQTLCHFYNNNNDNNNNCLLGSCSHRAGLDSDTCAYTYYKIHKIHNSHTTAVGKMCFAYIIVDTAVFALVWPCHLNNCTVSK